MDRQSAAMQRTVGSVTFIFFQADRGQNNRSFTQITAQNTKHFQFP
jgi:hypothetical protein